MFLLFEAVRLRGYVGYGVDMQGRVSLRGVFPSREEAEAALERLVPRNRKEIEAPWDYECPMGARHFDVAERVVRSLFVVDGNDNRAFVFRLRVYYEE